MALKFYVSVAKALNIKVLEANSNVCRSYMEKLVGGEGAFFPKNPE